VLLEWIALVALMLLSLYLCGLLHFPASIIASIGLW